MFDATHTTYDIDVYDEDLIDDDVLATLSFDLDSTRSWAGCSGSSQTVAGVTITTKVEAL